MDLTLDAILPSGLVRTHGPCEKPPDDYGDGFVLPDHCVKPLQTLHVHPNDKHLSFYADPHIYTWKGVPTTTSVTALAHEYEKPFVASSAIQSMKSSAAQAWPRLEYVRDAREGLEEWSPVRGALLACYGKTVSVLPPSSMSATASVENLKSAMRCIAKGGGADVEEDEEWHTYSRAMTDGEICAAWKANGNEKSHMGTERHLLAELFFNGLPFRWWEEDMGVLYAFCRDHLLPNGIVGYNTEKEIYFPPADLAGSLDLIVWDERRKVYHIIDHKRSDKLRGQMRGYGKMKAPMTHLDDCKGAGYALQTSIYQYILETEYGMVIGDRILLSLHNEAPFATSVPYLKAEVEYIMESRIAEVEARRATGMVCEMTGAALVNAVRLDGDRRLVMEKKAILMGVPYTVDEEARARFDLEVARHMQSVTLSKDVTAWRKLMPTEGIAPFSRV